MRRRKQPWNNKAPLKALAAVLLVGALVVAVRQQTHNEWESSESTTSEALRALRAADARARDAEAKAADADHALHEVRHTASTRPHSISSISSASCMGDGGASVRSGALRVSSGECSMLSSYASRFSLLRA